MKIHLFLITIAILSISWSSGMQVTGTFTDPRDGKVYKTVTIGTQTWMAENLKVTHYRNGVAIPNISEGKIWANLETGALCDYGNIPSFSSNTTDGRCSKMDGMSVRCIKD